MGLPDVVTRGEDLAVDLAMDVEHAGLTDEDLLLLAELAKGVTADRVGRSLDVSGRTVRRRLRHICDQIGVATAIEAVAWAARRRLI
jgi:DNA-binding CsgD family transcriptional regulator